MQETGFEVQQFTAELPTGRLILFYFFLEKKETHLGLSVEPGQRNASQQVTKTLV